LDTLTIADWGSFCTPKGCGKRKEEPCVNKLLIEFQKFYELFRIYSLNQTNQEKMLGNPSIFCY
ncbi:hypothetical protein FKZ16_04955, partial [Enterococcus faecalis]